MTARPADRRRVWLAAAISAGALVGAVVFVSVHSAGFSAAGDAARERGDLATALTYYDQAAYWLEDQELEYSLGVTHDALGHLPEAERHFGTAARLEAANAEYRVAHARALLKLSKKEAARSEIQAARERGYADQVILSELEEETK